MSTAKKKKKEVNNDYKRKGNDINALSIKKKKRLVCRACFLKRLKSKKGTTPQCGQSHKGILLRKLLTLKEWA